MEVNDRVLALSVLPNRGSTLNCSTCKGPFPFVLQQALMVLPEDCTNPFLLLPSIPSTDSSKIYIYIYIYICTSPLHSPHTTYSLDQSSVSFPTPTSTLYATSLT
ncbi:hypothetical protein, unlikely [Trypanosoma brucei gambiense DAL972]|uniref:Uncharacterized protein n=1 Tax=Trypanosoma brucei gambiense (strain MHOM/CI/86/DAL972) TaxID=679716 RepID=C9ZW28_TRYB9|nr:hypothetical protein, unlikely [Trypanosoma brucei gambiense DAL972]CBH13617.1 hypothetical protein, unlikely [Trypanosoma brucei gambiense DAL972]|eukprot:XP_011775893.1 hypothetical protein, unlikely [Trypanosoma brucei gambiense DAL972]